MKFLPFDINRSGALPDIERGATRFELGYVKGLGDERAERVVQARGGRPFRSLVDCIRRTGLDRRQMEALILAGACDAWGERRQLLWDLAEAFNLARRPPALLLASPDGQAEMPPLSEAQQVVATFAATGVTAGPHLVELRRGALPGLRRAAPAVWRFVGEAGTAGEDRFSVG